MFHIVIDAHSKWLEVLPMRNITATSTIAHLRKLFASYGFPDRTVTDNGPQYTSDEFESYLQQNGIQHTLSPPYHPATNGQAEIYVKTFKKMFMKCNPKMPMDQKVDHVLMTYRNTPHTTTGKTPAELFLKRAPKIKLSLVRPCLSTKVENKQIMSKLGRDGSHPVHVTYDLFQRVRVRHVRGGKDIWIPGTVVQVKGANSYVVRMPGNKHRFVHADHLRHDDSERNDVAEEDTAKPTIVMPRQIHVPVVPPVGMPSGKADKPLAREVENVPPTKNSTPVNTSNKGTVVVQPKTLGSTPPKTTRYGRISVPPCKLNL